LLLNNGFSFLQLNFQLPYSLFQNVILHFRVFNFFILEFFFLPHTYNLQWQLLTQFQLSIHTSTLLLQFNWPCPPVPFPFIWRTNVRLSLVPHLTPAVFLKHWKKVLSNNNSSNFRRYIFQLYVTALIIVSRALHFIRLHSPESVSSLLLFISIHHLHLWTIILNRHLMVETDILHSMRIVVPPTYIKECFINLGWRRLISDASPCNHRIQVLLVILYGCGCFLWNLRLIHMFLIYVLHLCFYCRRI
jgi:hypothetical protein